MKNIEQTLNEIKRKYQYEHQMFKFWLENSEMIEQSQKRGWKTQSKQAKEYAFSHNDHMNELERLYAFIKELDHTSAYLELRDYCDFIEKGAE